MYKLFVSGFNETLIDSEEAISISTMLEIDRIRQKGVIFTVATEDDLDSVLEYNRDFPFLDYIICYNGAFVYDVKKDKVIYRKNIGVSIVRKIIRLFSNYKICFYTSDNQYFFNNCISDRGSVDQFVEKNKKDVYKIEIECSRKRDLTNVVEIINKEGINVDFVLQSKDSRYYIEIVMKGINKFSAVEKICKEVNINIDEVIACGTLITDLELIKNVGLGIAMKNACKEVKRSAHDITFSNDNNGIENILKRYF